MLIRKLLLAALFGMTLAAPLALTATAAHAQGFEPNYAQPRQGFQSDDRRQRQSQNIISVRDAADRVRARYGGELLGAQLEQNGDRPFYILRWRMPSGDRRDFRVDAISGAVMG